MISGADNTKPYKNKEWLDEQINVLGKTQAQVARECGVSKKTISNWMKCNNIKTIKKYIKEDINTTKSLIKNELYKNFGWLNEQIKMLQKSPSQVARECGVSVSTIYNWVDIERTLKKRNINKNNKNRIKNMNYKNKEFLENEIDIKGKSIAQVSRECGVDSHTIKYWYNEAQRLKRILDTKGYYKKNKTSRLIYAEIYRKNDLNKIKIKTRTKKMGKIKYGILKQKMFDVLGRECVICGQKKEKFLTFDHKNNDGASDRANGHKLKNQMYDLQKIDFNEEFTRSKYRVLCYNHNCSENRSYLDFSPDQQSYHQRWAAKLWKEGLAFFGPCHCRESDLKFLTVSHIHNDGAERRRKGEGGGADLLSKFRKLGWPQSLKEDFCLECFNCNCSRGNRDE